MRNYPGTCKDICSYNSVYNFLIQLLPLPSFSFCGALFKRILACEQGISKGRPQNEIVPVLGIFHVPYSKYRGVKICFHSCRRQNQFFSLVSHSCRTRVARIWHSCCKLDQIVVHLPNSEEQSTLSNSNDNLCYIYIFLRNTTHCTKNEVFH